MPQPQAPQGTTMMRLTASAALAVFALSASAMAQTKGQEVETKANTEKLWRIECSGISG